MALSMDEQRMLAEIERRLSAEDPRLAARMSSFRKPGPAGRLRSPRNRIIGSLFTVILVAVVSMMVYAMVPFRAHGLKSTSNQSSPGVSAPARSHPQPATSGPNTSTAATAGGAAAVRNSAASTTSATPKTTIVKSLGRTAANVTHDTGGTTAQPHVDTAAR
jgi:cytoskeletal protein RodZ